MDTFSEYLIKSAAWLTGFTMVYLLFLRNERFFRLKRIYLLSGILVSLLFPLVSVHYQVEVPAASPVNLTFQGTYLSSGTAVTEGNTVTRYNYKMILFVLYITGVLFLGYRIIRQLIMIKKTINNTNINNVGTARLVRISSFPASFSFFNYVFINPSVDEAEVREIMNHELVHVKQKHWLDLFLVEMLRLLQWANPFVWIYTGFVRLNNEYLADELALQRSSNPANYKAALLNQLFRSPVLSLTNSFNYSLNKKRFDMMKKIITSPYRKLKVLLVLPVFAIVLYAFAIPEYNYVPSGDKTISPLTIFETTPIIQKVVKGIVTNKEGKPLQGVYITSTGTSGNARMSETGSDGRFIIEAVQPDASLMFFNRGYKQLTLKPDFNAEMRVIMDLDPEYKPPVEKNVSYTGIQQRPEQVVTIDGVISEKNFQDAKRDLGYDFGLMKLLPEKEAKEKYGDKGINGIIEITTRKKAKEMGIKTPFPRLAPTDFPTFSNPQNISFVKWVLSQAKYPDEAREKKLEGYVTVFYTVELDGTLSNVNAPPSVDPILGSEIIRVIKSSPKWDPPKNQNVDEPFTSTLSLRFKMPDQIEYYEEPFVVVEEMPMYPGGEVELLNFISQNTRYPEEAKAKKIEGRVFARFFVSTEGNAEAVTILKGVHPLLDAEAARVVSMLKGFKPGIQGGKAVNVWYTVPITFTLNKTDTPR